MSRSLIPAVLLALAAATPTLAQERAPAATSVAAPGPGKRGPMPVQMMFPNVSPEGRAILRQAMAATDADRAAVRAARDRLNALIAADRLDVAAVGRAMAEERALIDRQAAARQAGLLTALQQLSTADRKAFAADAQRGRERADARMAHWRGKGPDGAPPAPPPPPARP